MRENLTQIQNILTFFNDTPSASWVVHITRGFLACYSFLCYNFMIAHINMDFTNHLIDTDLVNKIR